MLQAIELIAVITCALYGGLKARQYGMDFIGVFTLAFIVALGGGTLRDLLLNRHPLFWIRHETYPVLVFGLAMVMCTPIRVPRRVLDALVVPDAVGMGLFSVAGAGYAMQQGATIFIAALMGVITGCSGGVISDIICNEIPRLFRPAPLYATCSFVGAWVYLLLRSQVPESTAMSAAIFVIVLFRLAAVKWNLRLPTYENLSS
jgi:uncharacterized membrane protein YeiH